jgi:hypothetical protein
MASVFLVKLDGFSSNDCTSLLEVVAKCFLQPAALFDTDGLLCRSPRYLLVETLRLGFSYLTCRVLALRTEEPLKVAIF